jgi:hypothetical protein
MRGGVECLGAKMRRQNYFAQVQNLTLARPIAVLPIRCRYRSNNGTRPRPEITPPDLKTRCFVAVLSCPLTGN